MARAKQMKLEQNPATNIDRISNLPDSLLCHILSFLPTAASVATCILSRRWRGLWEHLQVFNFVDKVFETSLGEAPKNFVQFVNTVLILRRVRHIQKFSLSCEVTDIHHEVTTWIRGATGRHLQELNISLFAPNTSLGYFLPESIFTCTALVSLYLDSGICLEQLSSVHLLSLKNLEVDIFCASAMDMLLRGCPVLETLKLKFQTWPAPSMKMPPSLKRLTFEDVIDGESDDENDDEIESFEMHTPSLEYLDIIVKGSSCYRFSASNLHNVVEAHLDIYPYYVHVEFVPKLLKELCRAKYLELKLATILCLLRVQPLDFPQFCCLVHLELDVPCFQSRFVIDLLCNCPILQILRIQSMKDIPLSAPWPQPTVVPYCLISHLKECVFGGYQDSTEEQALVAYILERGLILKTMKICSDDSMDIRKRHNILKGLSAIPRGSTMCRLIFD